MVLLGKKYDQFITAVYFSTFPYNSIGCYDLLLESLRADQLQVLDAWVKRQDLYSLDVSAGFYQKVRSALKPSSYIYQRLQSVLTGEIAGSINPDDSEKAWQLLLWHYDIKHSVNMERAELLELWLSVDKVTSNEQYCGQFFEDLVPVAQGL